MRALALALLLVACAAARPVGPTAVVRLVAPQEWSADDRARIADGLSAWRELGLDSRIHGDELAHVIAHELGHVLLNTGKHTTHGVMVTGGWMWALSAKDRALACEAIGRGCK
jgi:hypothetical protein